MNIIQKALIDERYIREDGKSDRETFRKFNRDAKDRKLFLFGGTKACDYFLEKYGGKYKIEYILDNDPAKNNVNYGKLSSGIKKEKYADILIKSPDILRNYCKDEILVLITSTNFYREIAMQLEEMGITAYRTLCALESSKWINRAYITYYHIKKTVKRKKRDFSRAMLDMTGWNLQYIKRAALFMLNRKFPIDNHKIIFHTFDAYMDHGKYIAEKILEKGVPCDIVWIVSDHSVNVPPGVRRVLCSDCKSYIYELATAKIWVNDMPFPIYVRKRKGQYYIQTKHWSSITLKKFYLDAPSLLKVSGKVKEWKYNGRIMDRIITGSRFDTESCRRGFQFKGPVWQIGSPRTDVIFKKEFCHSQVCRKCGITENKKLLLYAPTYRFVKKDKHNLHEMREITLDFEGLNQTLKQKFGGEWLILLRLHPSVSAFSKKIQLPEYVMDAGGYDDSQELSGACDIMISDYSSIMFEPCFAGKAVFLYAPDWKQYVEEEYELLIDIESLPFPVAEDNETLMENIRNLDPDAYREKVKSFLDQFGVNEDGKASVRAAERMIELMRC